MTNCETFSRSFIRENRISTTNLDNFSLKYADVSKVPIYSITNSKPVTRFKTELSNDASLWTMKSSQIATGITLKDSLATYSVTAEFMHSDGICTFKSFNFSASKAGEVNKPFGSKYDQSKCESLVKKKQNIKPISEQLRSQMLRREITESFYNQELYKQTNFSDSENTALNLCNLVRPLFKATSKPKALESPKGAAH